MLSPKQKAFADNYILTLNAGNRYSVEQETSTCRGGGS